MTVIVRKSLLFGSTIVLSGLMWIFIATIRDFSTDEEPAKNPLTNAYKIQKSLLKSYQWKEGSSATYLLRASTLMGDPSLGWSVSKIAGKVEFESILNIRVINIDGDIIIIGAQLSSVRFISDGREMREIEAGLNSSPFILNFNTHGAFQSIQFHPNLDSTLQGILRGIMDMQIVLPVVSSKEWLSKELDANGVLDVNYEILQGEKIRRKKLRYTHINQENNGISMLFENANYTSTIGGAWLKQYDGGEVLRLVAQDGTLLSISQVTKELRLINSAKEPDGLTQLPTGLSVSNLSDALRKIAVKDLNLGNLAQQRHQSELQEKYVKMPLEKVLSDLLIAVSNAQNHADTIPAIEEMRDWLLVHPESAVLLAQKLSNPTIPLEATARVVNAFGLSAESQASQNALATLLDNPGIYPAGVIAQAAVTTGGINNNLSQSLSDALFKAAFDLNSGSQESQDAALLALGALSKSNQKIAQSLIFLLSSNINPQESVTPGDRILTLQTLANGGIAPDAIVRSAQLLLKNNSDDAVRGEALSYLNTTGQLTPSDLLLGLGDSQENVRLRAIDIVKSSKSADQSVINQLVLLAKDSTASEGLRVSAVSALSLHTESYPMLAKEMMKLLQSDLPTSVRQAVRTGFVQQ